MPGLGEIASSYTVRDDYVGMALEWVSAVQMFRKPGTTTQVNPNVANVCVRGL